MIGQAEFDDVKLKKSCIGVYPSTIYFIEFDV